MMLQRMTLKAYIRNRRGRHKPGRPSLRHQKECNNINHEDAVTKQRNYKVSTPETLKYNARQHMQVNLGTDERTVAAEISEDTIYG